MFSNLDFYLNFRYINSSPFYLRMLRVALNDDSTATVSWAKNMPLRSNYSVGACISTLNSEQTVIYSLLAINSKILFYSQNSSSGALIGTIQSITPSTCYNAYATSIYNEKLYMSFRCSTNYILVYNLTTDSYSKYEMTHTYYSIHDINFEPDTGRIILSGYYDGTGDYLYHSYTPEGMIQSQYLFSSSNVVLNPIVNDDFTIEDATYTVSNAVSTSLSPSSILSLTVSESGSSSDQNTSDVSYHLSPYYNYNISSSSITTINI